LTSPFTSTASRLIDNGYSVIPVFPGRKVPGSYSMKEWWCTSEWQRWCDRLPTEIELEIWDTWPDAGICVPLSHSLKVIDIDTDDPAMMAAVQAVLPDSEVKKRGAKGFSAFYRGSPAIVSAPFSVGKTRVVDLLAYGRQTVLPPTIHPDTGQPYHWLGSETLESVSIDSLPLLPDNIAELLAAALEPFGYEPQEEHHRLMAGEGETYWRKVNDTALMNLSRWVPDLRLRGTKKHGQGYRAVADWRPEINSNARGEALSFHPNGITDWGTSENYTPISLVMQANTCDMYTATAWLVKQLGMEEEEEKDGFDVAGFIARAMAKAERVSSPLVAPQPAEYVEPVTDAAFDTIRAPRGKVDPFYLPNQGGLIEAVSEWILETSRAPVPEFATIAAITFLAAFFGRRYVTPTELGLNIYMIGIAGPGFGKDHPRRAIEMLGHSSGMAHLIGPNDVTSDSAIEKVVRRRPCFVMPFDEVGVLFQSMGGKNAASWARSIRKSLLELYSKSTAVWTGKEKADEKQDSSGDPVWFPTVSMLGMSTPTEFYAGITESNFGDGFMARLTIIEAKNQPKRQNGKSLLKTPTLLVERLKKDYLAAPSKGNLAATASRDSKQKPIMHQCEWGEGAEQRWKEYEQWQIDYMFDKPEYEGIVGRTAEQTLKIATVRAIGRNPSKPIVELEDVEYGYAIVQRSIDMIDDGVRKHMSSSEFETLHKLILSHVEAAGNDGVAFSVLRRKKGIAAAKNQDFDGAVKYLMSTEQLEAKLTTPKVGRPSTRYVAKNSLLQNVGTVEEAA